MSTVLGVLAAVLNTLWQAAIVAALMFIVLKLMAKINVPFNAATRYVIWWATLVVVLLLPAGPRLMDWWHARTQPAPAASTRSINPPVSTAPLLSDPPVIVTLKQDRTARWPLWIVALWAILCLYRLSQIGRSYLYLRGVKRRAVISPQPLPVTRRPARLLVSREIVSPMAVGFLRPAVVLPESLREEITPQELDHVLLHETAHIARRDDWTNLLARLLGAALALHPVAVWILRQIDRERETACYDLVVAKTGASMPYAASLALMFELRSARRGEVPGEALASGMFGGGSRLGERIELLLEGGRDYSPQASLAHVGLSAAVLLALVAAGSLAPRWIAFAQQPAFEVASVRLNPDGNRSTTYNAQGINFNGVALGAMIGEAYNIPYGLINGPDSLNRESVWGLLSETYDVTATAGRPVPKEQLRLMLQTLLADRFKLTMHYESKVQPVYKLVVRKTGPKLDESEPGGAFSVSISPDGFVFRNAGMTRLIGFLGVDRPVVDRTGLTGAYNFTLRREPRTEGPKTEPSADAFSSSIFTDIQKLGLKLEADTAPVEYPVVDHVEKPNAN